jgi:phage baseplate assembly protein gpV
MDAFLNRMKAQAATLDQAQGQPRFGVVSSVDPTRYAARVMLQPENVLSGWLPILSPWIGAGWGLACLPSPGDQVMVVPQEGDAEHGVIVGACWSMTQSPPVVAGVAPQCGEFWIVHRSGSFLRFRNDGSVEGQAAIWTLSGDLHVAGDVYDQHGALSALRTHYDQHHHTDSRGGQTSVSDAPD